MILINLKKETNMIIINPKHHWLYILMDISLIKHKMKIFQVSNSIKIILELNNIIILINLKKIANLMEYILILIKQHLSKDNFSKDKHWNTWIPQRVLNLILRKKMMMSFKEFDNCLNNLI